MAPEQMKLILLLIAAEDGRSWADEATFEAQAAAWHATIGDLDYDLATQAVRLHYRREPRRIMPADITAGVAEIRADRLSRTPLPDPPAALMGTPAWPDVIEAGQAAIAAGGDQAAASAAMETLTADVLRQRRELGRAS